MFKYSNVRLSFVDLRWAQLYVSLVYLSLWKVDNQQMSKNIRSSHCDIAAAPLFLSEQIDQGHTFPMTKAPKTRSSGSSRPTNFRIISLSLTSLGFGKMALSSQSWQIYGDIIWIFKRQQNLHQLWELQKPPAPGMEVKARWKFWEIHIRYNRTNCVSRLILYKELSSSIFQSCQWVSQASVTPVQISTLFNI